MTERHTPGLLTARQALHPTDGAYDFAIAAEISDRRQCIAEVFGRCSEADLLPAEANAARIVASWNATLPFTTEQLEAGIVGEMVAIASGLVARADETLSGLPPKQAERFRSGEGECAFNVDNTLVMRARSILSRIKTEGPDK